MSGDAEESKDNLYIDSGHLQGHDSAGITTYTNTANNMRLVLPTFILSEQKQSQQNDCESANETSNGTTVVSRSIHSSPAKTQRRYSQDTTGNKYLNVS